MRINFKEMNIKLTFEGEPVVMDVRHMVGNVIHQNTADLGMDELARKIYFSDGEVEVPEELIPELLSISASCFNVPLQQAIKDQL